MENASKDWNWLVVLNPDSPFAALANAATGRLAGLVETGLPAFRCSHVVLDNPQYVYMEILPSAKFECLFLHLPHTNIAGVMDLRKSNAAPIGFVPDVSG